MDGSLESGVSVYRALKIGGEWRLDGAYGSFRMMQSSERPLFEVSGVEIGTGSDGEPLLADAQIIRRSKIKIAGDCWQKQQNAEIGTTEAIYRNLITGQIWVALSGCEFRCSAGELAVTLQFSAPRRADRILAGMAL